MNVLNIIALILVPILAVVVGQKLQDRAQKRNDKMQIFKILMTSRIFGWTNESVQAMNLIDIVFADDKAVRKQWKICFDKMCVENPTETELSKIKTEREKLLETMAKSLGYKDIITWESIQKSLRSKWHDRANGTTTGLSKKSSCYHGTNEKYDAEKRKGK